MSEAKFKKELIGIMGRDGHFSAVESPSTSPGIPDIDFCIDGIEGHIELKYGTKEKAPNIRDSQLRWFVDRIKHGGRPIIFAKIDLTGNVFYCLYPGIQIATLCNCKSSEEWINLAPVVLDDIGTGLALKFIKVMAKGEM